MVESRLESVILSHHIVLQLRQVPLATEHEGCEETTKSRDVSNSAPGHVETTAYPSG